jgi:hypothetical protein
MCGIKPELFGGVVNAINRREPDIVKMPGF